MWKWSHAVLALVAIVAGYAGGVSSALVLEGAEEGPRGYVQEDGAMVLRFETDGGDAPFELLAAPSLHNNVTNDVFGFHYNRGGVSDEHPRFGIGFEGDYQTAGETRLLEYHFNYEAIGGGNAYRPISFDVDLNTHESRLHTYLRELRVGNRASLDQFFLNTGTLASGEDGYIRSTLPFHFQRNDAAAVTARTADGSREAELLRLDAADAAIVAQGATAVHVPRPLVAGSTVSAYGGAIQVDATGRLKHYHNFPVETEPRVDVGNAYGSGGIVFGTGATHAPIRMGAAIGLTADNQLSLAVANGTGFQEGAKLTRDALTVTTPLQLAPLPLDACTDALAGQIRYHDDGTEGSFFGCRRTPDGFGWARLDMH